MVIAGKLDNNLCNRHMANMDSIYQIAFTLLTSIGGASVLLFAFSSWLGKVWANRILASEKSKYSKELESLKHQYQISLNQSSIIHTSQKISFQNVIKAMHRYIKSLEQEYDEAWQPINFSYYDELKKIIIERIIIFRCRWGKCFKHFF